MRARLGLDVVWINVLEMSARNTVKRITMTKPQMRVVREERV